MRHVTRPLIVTGSPPGTRSFAAGHECRARQDLHGDDEIGCSEVDAAADLGHHGGTEHRAELRAT
jgi:hypothetical protein